MARAPAKPVTYRPKVMPRHVRDCGLFHAGGPSSRMQIGYACRNEPRRPSPLTASPPHTTSGETPAAAPPLLHSQPPHPSTLPK